MESQLRTGPDRPLRIPVVLGTVRRGRMSERVAHLLFDELSQSPDVETEIIDIGQLAIGIDDAGEAAKDPEFAALVSVSDGLVLVVPEYNHGYPGLLKHVLDTNYWEYAHRAVGLVGVSAGPIGGARAIENLIPIVKAVGLVPITWDLNVGNVATTFEDGVATDPRLNGRIGGFISEMVWMSTSLRYGRANVANHATAKPMPPAPSCPNDGAAMNRHAVMLRLPIDDVDMAHLDPQVGEVATDVFTCPVCGFTDGKLEPGRLAV